MKIEDWSPSGYPGGARAVIRTQQSTIDAVRTLHSRDAAGWCIECGFQWPCATVRVLDLPESGRRRAAVR